MSFVASDLPDDIDALKAMVLAAREEVSRKNQELAHRDLMIEKLKARLDKQLRDRFGSSSEGIEQLQLMLEDLEITRSAEAPAAASSSPETAEKPCRKPLPDHLPRQDQVLEAGTACASCGGKLKRVGEDVSEELEYVPGRFVVNRIIRPRMACSCCERFVQAPLPARPIERGRPGPGLLAHVLVSKYADHLPLYRQSQIYAREHIELGRSVLADWVGRSCALLTPVAEAIAEHVRGGGALHADDTPVGVLSPGRGKTATGRLWAYVRDERSWDGPAAPAAFYRFSMDRRGAHPAAHLAGYRGYVHADGYAGFNEMFRSGDITEVACLAHVRRKFFDLAQGGSSICAEAVARIAELYAVEEETRGKPPDERVRIRQSKARPALGAFRSWLEVQLPRVSSRGDAAGAIRYALSRLPRLEVYLDNGQLEIDNNAAERSIRGPTLGRKNYLFMGSEGGGEAAAIAYTLIETAKLNKIDPEAWLAHVLDCVSTHPASQIEQLLPWNHKA